jgi:hypothetical protein
MARMGYFAWFAKRFKHLSQVPRTGHGRHAGRRCLPARCSRQIGCNTVYTCLTGHQERVEAKEQRVQYSEADVSTISAVSSNGLPRPRPAYAGLQDDSEELEDNRRCEASYVPDRPAPHLQQATPCCAYSDGLLTRCVYCGRSASWDTRFRAICCCFVTIAKTCAPFSDGLNVAYVQVRCMHTHIRSLGAGVPYELP